MVKKLGLISLIFSSSSNKQLDSATSSTIAAGAPCSSSSSTSSSSMSWQWPSACKQQPRTLSFRQEQEEQKAAYKTMNSAYLPADSAADSCFSTSFASVDDDSLSTTSDEAGDAVIHALRTGRLFFEPSTSSPATSSILRKATKLKVDAMNDAHTTCSGPIIGDDDNKTALAAAAFEGATAMTMDSSNPYGDFRASMEEMVLSRSRARGHGGTIKDDWRWMEEMLGWYLRANGKSTHGLIVGAFVDLLIALSDDNTVPPPSSPTTASSSSSSTDEIKEEETKG